MHGRRNLGCKGFRTDSGFIVRDSGFLVGGLVFFRLACEVVGDGGGGGGGGFCVVVFVMVGGGGGGGGGGGLVRL